MSVDHPYYEWWLDAEGHPWIRHECKTDGHVDEYRLPPPWKLCPCGCGITPSLDCERCGAHSILRSTDKRQGGEE